MRPSLFKSASIDQILYSLLILLILGYILSEQAEIAVLQEKMRQEKRKQTVDLLIGVFGMAFVVLLLIARTHVWILVLTIFVAVAGLGGYCYYRHRYKVLMAELERMSIKIPTCPKCGKQLPQGNYTFCPFCSSPITTPPPPS